MKTTKELNKLTKEYQKVLQQYNAIMKRYGHIPIDYYSILSAVMNLQERIAKLETEQAVSN